MYSCADKVTSSAEILDISAMDFKSKPMNKEIYNYGRARVECNRIIKLEGNNEGDTEGYS